MEIKGRVAIVTGGTGGLGSCISRILASYGVHVALTYVNSREQAQSIAAELTSMGPKAVAIQADVTDFAQVERMVEQTREEFGQIDILVNNAAINKWIPFKELDNLTLDVWNMILQTNLTGPFQCIKAVAPVMKAQGHGRIVNISSAAGLTAGGSSIAYAVSKAGLIHLTRCMAAGLAPEITVNCIAPGFMEGTRMTGNLDPTYRAAAASTLAALRRPVDKDDVAEQVVTFCRSESTTGQTVVIDSGRFYH